jgi:diguanylate cyclase (GGDEF)-like protein/PAS domain S-box-containing protein
MEFEKILSLGLNPGDPDMPLAYRLLCQLIEEKYRPLLDESSDFMCIVDREGKFVYVNKNLADSLGYTKKHLLGMFLVDIIAQESAREFAEKTKKFLKSGRIHLQRMILKSRNGTRIVGEMSSMAFYDNVGRYCGAKAIFKDHTKLLEIEKLEKKYESILEDGIDSLDQVIMIVDKDFQIRWVSSSINKYFGADKSILVGEDVRQLFAQKLKGLFREEEKFLNNLQEAYAKRHPITSYECELMMPTGDSAYFMEHWSCPIGHGALSGGRIEIFRDITSRKKAEETLEYYYKKIHAIMEHAVEGVVEMRADNTIVFINSSFLSKLGFTDMEVLGRPLTDFILSEQKNFLASIKLIRRAREIIFVRKDGSLLYTLTSSIPLAFGAQGPHSLCFIADITEAKLGTLKLRDANLVLRALNDSLVDLSLRDPRTGLFNARYLNERLSQEFQRARRSSRPFSLLMMDIDFFKAMNDAHGHAFGDLILMGFAELLKSCVRATDVVVRFGGDEFVILLPDTNVEGAAAAAHKIIRGLKATLLGSKTKKMPVSISMGAAGYPDIGLAADASALLNAADKAMYQSKSLGRNRITAHNKATENPKEATMESFSQNTFKNMQAQLVNMNLRNEESVFESLRPMVVELDQHLGYLAGTIEKILKTVEALAMSFSLTEREIHNLKRAALLANIGFLEMPQEIFLKSSYLNPDELEIIRQHPLRSAAMIRDIPFLDPLVSDILCHHERFDGSGYPRGLSTENIPLGSRIIALAESYEALLRPRPYRAKPFSEEEALDIIRQESGKQFDPVVVEHFLKIAS